MLLFDRRGHRAALTPAGRALLDAGRELLRPAGDARAARAARRDRMGGRAARSPSTRIVPVRGSGRWSQRFYVAVPRAATPRTRGSRIAHEVLGGAWDALAEGRADLVLGASGDPPSGRRLPHAAAGRASDGVRRRAVASAGAAPRAAAARRRSLGHRAVVAADSSRRLPPRTRGPALGPGHADGAATSRPSSPRRWPDSGAASCRWFLAADDIAAGRLVARVVDVPRHAGAHAWPRGASARPGKALRGGSTRSARSGLALPRRRSRAGRGAGAPRAPWCYGPPTGRTTTSTRAGAPPVRTG